MLFVVLRDVFVRNILGPGRFFELFAHEQLYERLVEESRYIRVTGVPELLRTLVVEFVASLVVGKIAQHLWLGKTLAGVQRARVDLVLEVADGDRRAPHLREHVRAAGIIGAWRRFLGERLHGERPNQDE